MIYNIIRACRVVKNKLRHKFSPGAVTADIQMIVKEHLFCSLRALVKALDDFEGVVDYNYDAKGNFEAKLAGGAHIKITTEIRGE